MRVLIVGLSWPPETFLGRLIKGMADAGVEVIVACSEKPGHEWLSHPNLRWLWAPYWGDTPVIKRLLGLMGLLIGGLRKDPGAVWKIMHLGGGSFTDRLRVWHRLLPFVGQSWDVTYFPWNSAAIEYSPLFALGPPAVVSCRGSQVNVAPHDPSRQHLREELSLTFHKAAAVHCVSESIKIEASRLRAGPGKGPGDSPGGGSGFLPPWRPGEVGRRDL